MLAIGHTVLHGSYNHTGVKRLNRTVFASNLMKRVTDWFDWIKIEAWQHEHNKMHHFALGEPDRDPDCLGYTSDNNGWHQDERIPVFLRYILICCSLGTMWKWFQYTPNSIDRLQREYLSRSEVKTIENEKLKLTTIGTITSYLFDATFLGSY